MFEVRPHSRVQNWRFTSKTLLECHQSVLFTKGHLEKAAVAAVHGGLSHSLPRLAAGLGIITVGWLCRHAQDKDVTDASTRIPENREAQSPRSQAEGLELWSLPEAPKRVVHTAVRGKTRLQCRLHDTGCQECGLSAEEESCGYGRTGASPGENSKCKTLGLGLRRHLWYSLSPRP